MNANRKNELNRLAALNDEKIDFSDIPELSAEQFAKARRGGPRAGAGRKPKGYVPIHITVLPEAKARLLSQSARENRAMGQIVSELVLQKRTPTIRKRKAASAL